jgi:ornithine--oxo-acid transaminase
MLTIKPGQHGSTYGGNPVAAAVATASLQVLKDEKLADNAERMGRIFRSELEALRHPAIEKVRGKGLLNAVVIKDTREQGGFDAMDVCLEMAV